ncbi:conserved protein of unknown function [Cupriavidus taiwanensis]|nr:conserved protein of unknown function [Cupriavidus taiwanensis]
MNRDTSTPCQAADASRIAARARVLAALASGRALRASSLLLSLPIGCRA